LTDARHAEYGGDATSALIAPIACAAPSRVPGAPMLSGPRMKVSVVGGTRAAAIYGQAVIEEEFFCNYGLNPDYQQRLAAAGLTLTGFDERGEVRMIELRDRRFYLGTLFLPQLASTESAPHPVVAAFVRAAAAFAESRRMPSLP